MIEKKTVEATSSNHNNNNNNYYIKKTGIFIVRVTKGYQFVMYVRIILINCNRNVNRTIVFLILIYWWVG